MISYFLKDRYVTPDLIIGFRSVKNEHLPKSSRNKKGLNDVTAAPFFVFFAAGS